MTTEQEILLPGIVERISEPPPGPNKWPYFLAAYWPRDRRWKICEGVYSQPGGEGMAQEIAWLRDKGWTHITIMKLPELGRDSK